MEKGKKETDAARLDRLVANDWLKARQIDVDNMRVGLTHCVIGRRAYKNIDNKLVALKVTLKSSIRDAK